MITFELFLRLLYQTPPNERLPTKKCGRCTSNAKLESPVILDNPAKPLQLAHPSKPLSFRFYL